MTGLTTEELIGFVESVDGTISRAWPTARVAGEDDNGEVLTELWKTASELGWTDLQKSSALDAVIAACERLGRVACPLPLMDIYVTMLLFASDARLVEQVVTGEVRPVVVAGVAGVDVVKYVESAFSATHVVVIDQVGAATLRTVDRVTVTAGLAKPDWSEVELGRVVAQAAAGDALIEDAKVLLRLGLMARAIGAAQRSLEFSIEHAKDRVAFGKPIGAFQAVAHRTVDGATGIAATLGLVNEAVKSYLANRPNWHLASELAVEFGGPAAISAQFGAHHTLAAQGFFEEHEMPWLFRRVNADIVHLDEWKLAEGEVADVLIESDQHLPLLELGEEAEAFRREVAAFLKPYEHDEAVDHLFGEEGHVELTRAAAEKGYITMSWPVEAGGMGASVEKQMVIAEEMSYRRLMLPGKGGADMLGTVILRHGTPEQRARFLPLIATGEFPFYLGYSEPEIGSDLANLKTRAVRDGDEWVVNGRKMWGSGAHVAEWIWLATRTDPEAVPSHAGITVFLTKVDRPGFEIQKHRALSGEISCSTFLDDFRIPDADRIGDVNGGWKVITEALAQERVMMANFASAILRMLDDMLDEVRRDPFGIVGDRGSAKRHLITELAARLQAARGLVNASIRATATSGGGVRLEAPLAKILASVLHEDFGEAALRIFGPAAALGEHLPGVPGRGAFEYNLRLSIMQVVGGGTIDIQKNLVARSLGLPR